MSVLVDSLTTGLVVAVVVALGSVCQVLSGVGFALVVSPLVIVTLGHDPGVRLVLVLSAVLNLVVIARMPGEVRPKEALKLLVPAALAIGLMTLVKDQLSGTGLNVGAGVAILAATGVAAAGRPLPFFEGRSGPVVAGGLSGSLNVLSGAAGPPVALFAASRGWPPASTSATLQAYSLPLNLITCSRWDCRPPASSARCPGRWPVSSSARPSRCPSCAACRPGRCAG
ncbi:hypothetical protein [Kineosporia succinea]|uniref:Membrane transporter protein n=1 Tax=Kineosporia succinea TaxID=84632 RepID=A0ABT9NX71_9ACTN|nr:hypothetical protein [Kineosporia succinea]MDP9824435.1 hypothetical protein [Kineosporia succinea]